MARFDKIAVLDKIGSTGMVPVFYHKDAEVAKKVVKACYDGGVRAFEFTNRGDFAHEELVKGLLAPMPWSKLMVTGGVEPTQENLTSWIKAGVFCVGMGSKLFPGDKVAAEDWAYVTAKCKEALGYIAEARANK